MQKKQMQKNLLLYKWYQLFREPLFWGPILILYVTRLTGMKLEELFFMEGITYLMIVALEIPSGAIADMIGRKKTIFIGMVLECIHVIILLFATQPIHIWIENIIWAVGYTLISGADVSLIYDSLKSEEREDEFKTIHGKANANRFLLIAICSLSVGFLGKINLRLPAILSLIPFIVNVWVVSRFTEPPITKTGKVKLNQHWDLMKTSVLFVANHLKLKWIIGFTALMAIISKLWFFTYNPYFEMVNLPLEYYGVIFFSLNIVSFLFSYFADKISKKLTDYQSVGLITLSTMLPLAVMSIFVRTASSWLVLFQNIGRGYSKVFNEHMFNDYLDSENRATCNSISSAVVQFICAISLMIFSKLVLARTSLPNALQYLAIFGLTGTAILLVTFQKIMKK